MVIGRGVTLPVDEVLKGFGMAEEAGIKDGINFIVFFAVHKVREGTGEVQAMSGSFVIR